MKRIVFAISALLCASLAFGGTLTLTWVNPTTNTDGSPLTLASINVYRGSSASGPFAKIGSVPPLTAGGAVPATYADTTAVGTDYYYVTAVSATGTESAPSATVSATVVETPSPPTNLSIK